MRALKVALMKLSSLLKGQSHEVVGRMEKIKGSFYPLPRSSQWLHPGGPEKPTVQESSYDSAQGLPARRGTG